VQGQVVVRLGHCHREAEMSARLPTGNVADKDGERLSFGGLVDLEGDLDA